MRPARGPVFVERQAYRARRWIDALRLLPFVGVVLWMVPVLWPTHAQPDGTAATNMSYAVLYIFSAWGLLIALCAVTVRSAMRNGDALNQIDPDTDPTLRRD